MNRSSFASSEPLDVRPGIGQRWVLNLTDDQILERAMNLHEDRQDMMIKIWQFQRDRGFVIVGENEDEWITHVKPVNPHPKHRTRTIKKAWLKPYKFKGFEEIA